MENQELVNQLIANGRKALAELESYTQEQIDELCRVCCEAFAAHAEELAEEAVAETGLAMSPTRSPRTPTLPTASGTPSRIRSPWASSAMTSAAT